MAKTKPVKCNICGESIEGPSGKRSSVLLKHKWAAHKDIMLAKGKKGKETQRLRHEGKIKSQELSPGTPDTGQVKTTSSPTPKQELEKDDLFSEGQTPPVEPANVSGNGHGEVKETEAQDGKKDKAEIRGKTLAKTLGEANVIHFVSKEFRLSSTLFQMTKHITETDPDWDWPVMEEGDWLDTFFYEIMKRFGYILGGYQKVRQEEQHVSKVHI